MEYFVSYFRQHKESRAWTYGRCCITMEKPVSGIEDIQDMEDAVEESQGTEEFNYFVMNYQAIEKEK